MIADLAGPDAGSPRDGAAAAFDLSSVGAEDLVTASQADANPDAAADPLAPHPPKGATLCGHGMATAAEAAKACAEPSFALDQAQKLARRCDGAKVTGVSWEVYCSGGGVYLWVRYHQLQANARYPGCMGFLSDQLTYGWRDVSDAQGGRGGAMTVAQAGEGFNDLTPLEVVASDSVQPIGPSGTGNLYLFADFNDTCGGAPVSAVVSGVAVQWDAGHGG